MDKTGHYLRYQEDFRLAGELGINALRYGPPYYRLHCGPGRYDWAFTDDAFHEIKQLGIKPCVDLCLASHWMRGATT